MADLESIIETAWEGRDKIPKDIKGLPAIYRGDPLIPHKAMAELVEARVAEGQRVSVKP